MLVCWIGIEYFYIKTREPDSNRWPKDHFKHIITALRSNRLSYRGYKEGWLVKRNCFKEYFLVGSREFCSYNEYMAAICLVVFHCLHFNFGKFIIQKI